MLSSQSNAIRSDPSAEGEKGMMTCSFKAELLQASQRLYFVIHHICADLCILYAKISFEVRLCHENCIFRSKSFQKFWQAVLGGFESVSYSSLQSPY